LPLNYPKFVKMSGQNGSAASTQQGHSNPDAPAFDKGKGKGKATAEPTTQDMSMGEEEDSSSEDEIDEVSLEHDPHRRALVDLVTSQTAEVGESNTMPFQFALRAAAYYLPSRRS
jgi:hypothetical protein